MSNTSLSAIDAIKFGVAEFSRQPGYCVSFVGAVELVTLVAALSVTFSFVAAAQLILQMDIPSPDSFFVVFGVAYLLIRSVSQLVLNKWFLVVHDGGTMTFADLLAFDFGSELTAICKLLAASVIYSFYVGISTLFLLFPGLIASSTLQFYKFLILEEDIDALGGLEESWELSGEHRRTLVGMGAICLVLKLLGLAVAVVGLIPATAVCGLAQAYAYKKLLIAQHEGQA